jgi:hypothetical protein
MCTKSPKGPSVYIGAERHCRRRAEIDDESEANLTDRVRRKIIQSVPMLAGLTAAGLPLGVTAKN